jgi:hypothetical protein
LNRATGPAGGAVDEDIDDVADSAESTGTVDDAVAESDGGGSTTSTRSVRRPNGRKPAGNANGNGSANGNGNGNRNGNGRASTRSKPAAVKEPIEPVEPEVPAPADEAAEPETLDSIVVGDAVLDDVEAPAMPADEPWSPSMPADEAWSSAKFASSPVDPVPSLTDPVPSLVDPVPSLVDPSPSPEPLLSAPPMPSEFEFPRPSASARYVAGLGTTPAKPSFTPSTPASTFGSSSPDAARTAPGTAQSLPTQSPPTQAFPRTKPAAGASGAAARKETKQPKQPKAAVRKSAARQAHLTIARIEPWSVMKFSFAVSVIAFIILFVVVAILYGLLSALGVFTSIQHLVSNVTSSSGQSGVDATKWFSASKILGYTVLLGGLNIVLITAISTIGAVIYNLTSRLIGGGEVTLKEAD